MRQGVLTAGLAALVCASAGCGGDDASDNGASSGSGTSAVKNKAVSLDPVLSCLKAEGLKAEDQSSSTGKKIGIDYPAGRLVISFEESAEAAESYASVAKANNEAASVKGTVAITIPDDPAAEAAQPAVEQCVESS